MMIQSGQRNLKFWHVAARILAIVVVLGVALSAFGLVVPVAMIGTLLEIGPYWAVVVALSLVVPAWCFVTWGAMAIHYGATLIPSNEPRWRYAPRFGGLWPQHEWVRNVDATEAFAQPLYPTVYGTSRKEP